VSTSIIVATNQWLAATRLSDGCSSIAFSGTKTRSASEAWFPRSTGPFNRGNASGVICTDLVYTDPRRVVENRFPCGTTRNRLRVVASRRRAMGYSRATVSAVAFVSWFLSEELMLPLIRAMAGSPGERSCSATAQEQVDAFPRLHLDHPRLWLTNAGNVVDAAFRLAANLTSQRAGANR